MQNPNDWLIGYVGPWDALQPRGGVAPSRANLALARHLEKRAAHLAAERDAARGIGVAMLALRKLGRGILAQYRRENARLFRLVG